MKFRLWPLAVIAALYAASFVIVPIVLPEMDLPLALIGAVLSGVLILVWWLLLSRARWFERLAVVVAIVPGVMLTRMAVDPSIAGGAQNMLAYMLGAATFAFAVAAWALIANRFQGPTRYLTLLASFLLVGVAPMLSIRTAGVHGGGFEMHWRWTPTPEARLLAQVNDEPKPLPATEPAPSPVAVTPPAPTAAVATVPSDASAAARPESGELRRDLAEAASGREGGPQAPPEWPGFRGPNRDGVVKNVSIKTDWSQTPPTEMWRRPVGPGWSSFSVRGDVFYTQEQRGNDEIVAAYRVSTGEPVWRHRDPIRFYESNGGAGPRGTPTIYGKYVFAMGATGMLNALDARTGKGFWSHNTMKDTGREIPMWGISSSPIVVDDLVIVSAYGTLAAYDVATGKLRWIGPKHGGSYSSPHLITTGGVRQVVILSSPGAVAVDPVTGKQLWEHTWEGGAIVQPAVTDDGDVLINAMAATGGIGTRRLAIKRDGEGWKAEEKWTSNGLKPYFNDFVIHNGYAYGFDGSILSCIDLSDGKRKWKGGRYGNGQMVLLAEQDLLLVMSEEGELALVSATPDQYKEIAKFPVFDAKTWNHPVIVRDVLLVRNGEEMAAFRLPMADAPTTIH